MFAITLEFPQTFQELTSGSSEVGRLQGVFSHSASRTLIDCYSGDLVLVFQLLPIFGLENI